LRALSSAATLDLIASFQRAVVDNLLSRTMAAAEKYSARTVLISGGVAANSELRRAFEKEGSNRGMEIYFPSRALSTDNAAMIAAAGYARFLSGERADSTLNAEANLPLA
jgi:N6-L-threonylcarbamoyladenine synthase